MCITGRTDAGTGAWPDDPADAATADGSGDPIAPCSPTRPALTS